MEVLKFKISRMRLAVAHKLIAKHSKCRQNFKQGQIRFQRFGFRSCRCLIPMAIALLVFQVSIKRCYISGIDGLVYSSRPI